MDHTVKNKFKSCILCGYNPKEQCSFMLFPSKEERKNTWLLKCNLPPDTNVRSARLCSKHFCPDDFSERATKRLRLKKDAVPSVFFHVDDVSESVPEEKKSIPRSVDRWCFVCKVRTTEPTARFPRKEVDRKKWMEHFNIPPETNVKEAFMCTRHFRYKTSSASHRRSEKIIREADEETENIEIEIEAAESNVAEDSLHVSEANPSSSLANECISIPTTPTTHTSAQHDTSINRRRIIFPRYPADIRTPHLETPRRAKRCIELTKSVIHEKKSKIKALQKELYRAKLKIRNLEDIIKNHATTIY